MEADLASKVLPKPPCIAFWDGNVECGFCMKSAVSGRGMWGVWMTGGLRKVATSCGDGPEVATWFCDRWLICNCCCTMRASSLSRRASALHQPPVSKHFCSHTGLGRPAADYTESSTHQAHAHSLLSGLASYAVDKSARSRQSSFFGVVRPRLTHVE